MALNRLHRRRAVFLDKDGTLVDDVPYNVDPDRIRLTPRAGAALSMLHRAAFRLVVVTNQSGVAHRRMERGREEEADAGFGETSLDDGRRRRDANAKRLVHIGAAGTARGRSVAVLRHAHTARRNDNCHA